MKRSWVCLISLTIQCFLLGVSEADQIQVTIDIPKTSYYLGEAISATATAMNLDTRPYFQNYGGTPIQFKIISPFGDTFYIPYQNIGLDPIGMILTKGESISRTTPIASIENITTMIGDSLCPIPHNTLFERFMDTWVATSHYCWHSGGNSIDEYPYKIKRVISPGTYKLSAILLPNSANISSAEVEIEIKNHPDLPDTAGVAFLNLQRKYASDSAVEFLVINNTADTLTIPMLRNYPVECVIRENGERVLLLGYNNYSYSPNRLLEIPVCNYFNFKWTQNGYCLGERFEHFPAGKYRFAFQAGTSNGMNMFYSPIFEIAD